MNAQKERKTEYKREHFAILRRKRMDQRDSSADILILRILSGAFAAHGCAPPRDSITHEEFYNDIKDYIVVGNFQNGHYIEINGTSYGMRGFNDGIFIAYDQIFNMKDFEKVESTWTDEEIIENLAKAALEKYNTVFLGREDVDEKEHAFSLTEEELIARIRRDYYKLKGSSPPSDDSTQSTNYGIYQKNNK